MSGESPDWVRDAIRQFLGEVRAFVRTAVDFTTAPSRFAREWVDGSRHALNPLGFLATAFAVAAPASALFARLVQLKDEPSSLVVDALAALLPFAYYLALGSVQHGVLRLCGSRRKLRDSCAMALYAGGGPALAAQLIVFTTIYALYRFTGKTNVDSMASPAAIVAAVGAIVAFGIFCGTLGAALGGVHRRDGIRVHHVLAANVIALVVTGSLFALLRPPGNYGLHLVLGPTHTRDGWRFAFALLD